MKKASTEKGPTPTIYSKALAEAVRKAERVHEDIGAALGVTPGLVSAWVTGRKPVPATRATPLADYLANVAPEAISEAYATINRQQASNNVRTMPGTAALRPELALNRVENDIDSLRMALSVMVGVMLRHRPAEALDVLDTIQRTIPKKYRDQGFLLELTEALDRKQPAASAKARASARPPSKPRSA